jgi:hypothetical protein
LSCSQSALQLLQLPSKSSDLCDSRKGGTPLLV